MRREEFYLNDDGIRLHAKLDRPENVEKGPLCIVIHGLTGNMEERQNVAVSRAMNELGIATLRVELYGHGLSDGDFEFHTVEKWLHNIDTVTDYAKSLDFVTELYLCGHSQGGLAVIMAAGRRPDDYDALIPLSPAIMIPRLAKEFPDDGVPEAFYFHDLRIDRTGHSIRTPPSAPTTVRSCWSRAPRTRRSCRRTPMTRRRHMRTRRSRSSRAIPTATTTTSIRSSLRSNHSFWTKACEERTINKPHRQQPTGLSFRLFTECTLSEAR